MASNPFTPTFGVVPAFMAGREDITSELLAALEEGVGNPNLTTIISGARGTGKTALLTYLSDAAQAQGWVSVNVSALLGMLEEIVQQAHAASAHLIDTSTSAKLASLKLGDIAEVQFSDSLEAAPTWRIRMGELLDALAETDTGLLITVDEVRDDLDEMIQLASAFQHFVRERRKVALFMAGLPAHVSALLQDKSVSFLRRANFYNIGIVSDFEVEEALGKTFNEGGREATPEALKEAVQLIGGFPYMMQLVGYRAWNASPDSPLISEDDVLEGSRFARNDLQRKVFDTTFRELSKGDVRFLVAMLEDDGPSELADVARRLGKRSNYASQYKRRLQEQGIVGEVGQGRIRIELPMFKDYLRDQLL